ncbi:MAG TPA: hypothetical protein VNK05_03820 [Chloroflexota bacterium]|nr:hypothetical protein [Chloroflexota bacterium]
MNPDESERRLVDAESSLARALQRLHSLRRAALAGGYDPIEFDRALVAYRRAEREAVAARQAWASAHEAGVLTATSPAAGEEPFEPTPRLRFVRWLVQSGRISEWETATPPAPEREENRSEAD